MPNLMKVPETPRVKNDRFFRVEKRLAKKLPKGKRVSVRLRSHGM